ncbi:cyclopropane-fatty-acyl-phospholipid synthase [Biscogniauxia marginata]|nr:cyclopropane-fatty-acyl-phospholipid synthase [Biscogniauxia marginata]
MAATDPSFSSVRYLPTDEAYDRWAAIYDTDGNFLQAIDSIEMKTLFPRLIASIESPRPWRIVDLGCGTGRNTALLLNVPDAEIIALDASRGMLDVAKSRLSPPPPSASAEDDSGGVPTKEDNSTSQTRTLRFEIFDLLSAPASPEFAQRADAVISTLVVEHVPLAVFFSHVSRLLKRGGVLLLTNMHAHMGSISQAGFVDAATGEKIRPTSYAHTVQDVVAEARRWGLEVEEGPGGGVEERTVEEGMVERLGPRSAKWVGITCWFGGLFRKVEDAS